MPVPGRAKLIGSANRKPILRESGPLWINGGANRSNLPRERIQHEDCRQLRDWSGDIPLVESGSDYPEVRT
jgi:hypothetical protein